MLCQILIIQQSKVMVISQRITATLQMESMYSLQENHLRIIWLALTKIDTKKNEFGENTFTTEEFSKYYGLNVKECDRYIKDAIKRKT